MITDIPEMNSKLTSPTESMPWWDNTQTRQGKRSFPDLRSHIISQKSNVDHRRAASNENAPKGTSRNYQNLNTYTKHGTTLDNSELPSQCQTTRTVQRSTRTHLTFLSFDDSEVQPGGYVDDSEVLRRISILLRSPVTPTAERFSGPHGKPLGVEVAINEYHRGECSTGDFDQDLLPLALRPRPSEDLTKDYSSDQYVTQSDGFPDLHSLYAAATNRRSIAFADIESLLTEEVLDEGCDTESDPQIRTDRTAAGSRHSQISHRFFDELIRTIDSTATGAMQDESAPNGSDGNKSLAGEQTGQRLQLNHRCPERATYPYPKPTELCLHSRYSPIYCASHGDVGSSKTKLPRPRTITPESLQMPRLHLRSRHRGSAGSNSSGQFQIHPALRTSITASPLPQLFEDQTEGDDLNDDSKLVPWYSSETPSSLTNATLHDNRSTSTTISTLPTCASASPPTHFVQEWRPQSSSLEPKPLAERENNAPVEKQDSISPPSHEKFSHLDFNRVVSPSAVAKAPRSVTKIRQTAIQASCPSDSAYSLRRMLTETEAGEGVYIRKDAAACDTPSVPSPATKVKNAHAPQAGEPLPGTMLGGLLPSSPTVAGTLTSPRCAPFALKIGPRAKLKRFSYRQKPSDSATVPDEIYLRAQRYLLCQRSPPSVQPPAAGTQMTFPKHRPASQTASKLTRFFGDDYTKLAEKNPEAIRKEQEHQKMVQQVLGGSKRRLSGVREDVKKGLKRLLG
ncbi:MAG: hypothetical protein Q9164_003309 [Protoblastenia rupestris]